jgi:type II secretory pathway component PulF
VEVLRKAQVRSRSATGHVLMRLKEALKAGQTLSRALADDPYWFDPMEVAMVEAGQHGGTLPSVLRTLADRHERSGQLSHKLVAALAYPLLVSLLGLGVVVFLSTKTLPDLARILTDAGVEVPALTRHVMGAGMFLAEGWPWLLCGVLGFGLSTFLGKTLWSRHRSETRTRCPRYLPQLVRRMRAGALASSLAELLRSGVPMVEALRVLAPTAGFLALRQMLLSAAHRLEHGVELSEAFREGGWFDEFLRLLDLGQSTGELPALLERISRRYVRSAERQLDRLSAFLEPAAVMALAVLVGIVALSAVLPLFQLQEVL